MGTNTNTSTCELLGCGSDTQFSRISDPVHSVLNPIGGLTVLAKG